MQQSEFESRLSELENATLPARARSLWHQLAGSLERVDAVLRERCRVAAQRHALPWREPEPATLRVGEAWVLLFEAPDAGRVVRLSARHGFGVSDPHLLNAVRRCQRALLAAAARCSRHLDIDAVEAELDIAYRWGSLEGNSLDASVAVALASLECGQPAAASVAVSACLDEAGSLTCVEHLDTKLAALRRDWPHVRQVIVAPGQLLGAAHRRHFEVVERNTLEKALLDVGLDLRSLPIPARLNAYRSLVSSFREENERNHPAAEWRRLSLRATQASAALALDEPSAAARAEYWAALFALHAGDAGSAAGILGGSSWEVAAAYPALRALSLVVAATVAVDADPANAMAAGERAVTACRSLEPEARDQLLGQALGSHGRALLHGGNALEAEPLLEEALVHHRRHDVKEAGRSACYLATCLRMSARPEAALAVVNEALDGSDQVARRGWDLGWTTRRYLLLERGRIFETLERWSEARADLELVVSEGRDDASYPHLGGLRSLAGVLRQLGNVDRADELLTRCSIVVRERPGSILARVAGLAASDALLSGAACRVSRQQLLAVWEAAFGEPATPESVRASRRLAIY